MLKKFFLVLVFGFIFLIFQLPRLFDQKTRLIFCNVGQGDGAILISPQNVLLIDAGRDAKMRECLTRHLPFWKREIFGVILTHPDVDHVKGLKSVIESYSVRYLFSNFTAKKGSDYSEIIDILRNSGTKFKSFTKGEKISVNSNFSIEPLWPLNEHSEAAGDTNLFSTVSVITIGQSRFLMLADAEISSQIELLPEILAVIPDEAIRLNLESKNLDPRLRLSPDGFSPIWDDKNRGGYLAVKLSHHGSSKNFSYTLIRETKPKYAIISVGKNSFGHPGKNVLEMLEKLEIEVLRTDSAQSKDSSTNAQDHDFVFECERECEIKSKA